MSRIDELIAEHCPDGVRYLKLSELAHTVPGLTGKKKADFSDGNARFASYRNIFAHPSLDQGAPDFVKVREGERQNTVQRGDILITGSSESRDEVGMSSVVTSQPSEAIYLNSFCFIVRPNQNDILEPDFAKHLFRSELVRKQIRGTASGVTRINISKPRFMKVTIPVPPLEVQRAVAEILDSFSQLEVELEVELEAELVARKQQYEHYRDYLFGDNPREEWVSLGELGTLERGSALQKKDLAPEGVPAFHYGQVYTHYGPHARRTKSFVSEDFAATKRLLNHGDLFVATTSENEEDLGKAVAWLGNTPAVASGDAYIFRPAADARYVSYFFTSRHFQEQKKRYITGTKIKRISGEAIGKIEIPIPTQQKQTQVADHLDQFVALLNDLSVELSSELLARRQQYEYYRNKLLTFSELKDGAKLT